MTQESGSPRRKNLVNDLRIHSLVLAGRAISSTGASIGVTQDHKSDADSSADSHDVVISTSDSSSDNETIKGMY